ncbi:SMP-30/gluconolactonase/LRE family protein [Ruegeria hyattellae]|uniref:SMP-30/gluconolactonase/LRE family protein n=1 Tax=Ruegeria hyattellae TaxID=3233337 RepID=UPI00355AF966
MVSASDIRHASGVNSILGEGVRYDKSSDTVFWLDIPTSRVWRFLPDGGEAELFLGHNAAFACLTENGSILAGGEGGFFLDGAPMSQD